MLYLWIFGDNIEKRVGHVRFLVFYLVCGLAAGFGHIAFNSRVERPDGGGVGGDQRRAGRLPAAVPAQPREVLTGYGVSRSPRCSCWGCGS